jgi:precorrin-6B methylase 1
MGSLGSLVCVGAGVTLASHLTPLARSYIEKSDVVFAGLADATVELWMGKIRPDLRSFQPIFRQGMDRSDPYRRVMDAVLAEVRAGKTVCVVFYGHPAMFSSICHHAVDTARREGHRTHIEPAISAADCLYAELGIDPGKYGCQHYEVSEFMLYRRLLDTSAYLILWQAGVRDDPVLARLRKKKAYRRVLVDVLARDYALEHEVIIYKAAYIPVERPYVLRTTLGSLASLRVDHHGTLVLPPAMKLEPDPVIRERLAALEQGGA